MRKGNSMRAWVVLVAAAAVGCAGTKPLPRWLVVTDPRVELSLEQSSTMAIVGDSVYVEVGRSVPDPDSKGYIVVVDGRRVEHPEWDIKYADLRYRFRAKDVGIHQIEITVPRKDSEPTTRSCMVSVVE